ncbi:predicted protein, partial [Nematostella vectensis]
MEDFPTEYDAIVLGTGLPEAVVAAALSRIGLKVLHLDRNDYYSSQWASFTFDGLLKWIQRNQKKQNPVQDKKQTDPITLEKEATEKDKIGDERTDQENETGNKEITDIAPCVRDNVTAAFPAMHGSLAQNENNEITGESAAETTFCLHENVSEESTIVDDSTQIEQGAGNNVSVTQPGSQIDEAETSSPSVASFPISRPQRRAKPAVNSDMTYSDLEPYHRQFNIDLAPKLLLSRGALVESLISANISHYAEFKAVNQILTFLEGSMEAVPCSRSDVFSSKLIPVIEKRLLMKFLTFCLDHNEHLEEYKPFEDKPFVEFLKSRRMTPNLQHFVIHAIAMVKPDALTIDGLNAAQSFLMSLGRYGNSPFIWPLYGLGELPQAYCRMCAVFGGLYCLRKSAESIVVDTKEKKCVKVVSEGQELKCKWLIMEHTYLPSEWREPSTQSVSRAVFITDKSIKQAKEENVTMLTMPAASPDASPVLVLELSNSTQACPCGLYLVHLVSEGCVTAQEDLEQVARKILHFPENEDDRSSDKPVVLWSLYFNHDAPDPSTVKPLPDNVFSTSLPGVTHNLEQAMRQAKDIFTKICGPDEEFLPAVPNPEDIILDD